MSIDCPLCAIISSLISYHRDSVRKHWKSCLLRKVTGGPLPDLELPERKRRACDNCASSKRACSLDMPCRTCVLKELPCSYLRTTPLASIEMVPDSMTISEDAANMPDSVGEGRGGYEDPVISDAFSRVEEGDVGMPDSLSNLLEVRTGTSTVNQANLLSPSIFLTELSMRASHWVNPPYSNLQSRSALGESYRTDPERSKL